MSFLFLLVILSLAIIIPALFVWRANNRLNTQPSLPSNPPINQQKMVNIDNLPKLFQQILKDIEAQFAKIYQKNQQNAIHSESFLLAKRLFYTRLPDMVADYLQLDSHYAKHTLIDVEENLTSFDIMQQQLKSILNLFYQINQSSNDLFLQNILTNQRYLHTLNQQTGFDFQLNQPNAMPSLNPTIVNSDRQTGLQYIEQFLPNQTHHFSENFCQQLGELVYFASITQLAIDDEFRQIFAKNRIQADLQLENLAKLLHEQLPKALQSAIATNCVKNIEIQLLPLFKNLNDLLSQILATLDTGLATADKLALVQNLHDDFGTLTNQFFVGYS